MLCLAFVCAKRSADIQTQFPSDMGWSVKTTEQLMITNVFFKVSHRKYSSVSFWGSALGEDFVHVNSHSQFSRECTCFLTSNPYRLKTHIHRKNKKTHEIRTWISVFLIRLDSVTSSLLEKKLCFCFALNKKHGKAEEM